MLTFDLQDRSQNPLTDVQVPIHGFDDVSFEAEEPVARPKSEEPAAGSMAQSLRTMLEHRLLTADEERDYIERLYGQRKRLRLEALRNADIFIDIHGLASRLADEEQTYPKNVYHVRPRDASEVNDLVDEDDYGSEKAANIARNRLLTRRMAALNVATIDGMHPRTESKGEFRAMINDRKVRLLLEEIPVRTDHYMHLIRVHGADSKKNLNQAVWNFNETQNEFLSYFYRMIFCLAEEFSLNDDELDEYFQQGCIGAFGAMERFDPRLRLRFTTMAYPWAKQAMLRLREEKRKVWSKEVSIDAVDSNGNSHIQSIAQPDDDGREVAHTLSEELHVIVKKVLTLLVSKHRSGVSQRNADVFTRVYGPERVTYEDVGAEFHVTKERIRQIHNQTLRKIRRHPLLKDWISENMPS